MNEPNKKDSNSNTLIGDSAENSAEKSAEKSQDEIAHWAVVVDDSNTSVNVISGILKNLKLGIHTFRSAAAALKYLKEIPDDKLNKIAIVFSDMDMPNMNGLQFLTELRKEERLKNLNFVIISGQVDKKLLGQFAAMKIDGYIVKPFKSQSLIDRVNHAIEQKEKKNSAA